MPKLSSKAKGSKLRELLGNKSHERVLKKPKDADKPTSYRTQPYIRNILKDTVTRLNQDNPSNRKISEARVLNALIYMSKDMDSSLLLMAVKDAW